MHPLGGGGGYQLPLQLPLQRRQRRLQLHLLHPSQRSSPVKTLPQGLQLLQAVRQPPWGGGSSGE